MLEHAVSRGQALDARLLFDSFELQERW